jgi:putative acetyltransferase
MLIRPETTDDIAAIYALTKAAFASMPFSDGSEPDCINQLRKDGDLTLSLVAEVNDVIIGHVAFSPVTLNEIADNWFGLGPISVHPDHQRSGIGSALINEGLSQLKDRSAKGCVLIGDPNYYSRFGFVSDGKLTYHDLPPQYVQWLGFNGIAASGKLLYRPGLGP